MINKHANFVLTVVSKADYMFWLLKGLEVVLDFDLSAPSQTFFFYWPFQGGAYVPGLCVSVVSYTVELQWLEHQWLLYHALFKLIFESLQIFSDSSRKQILKEIFLFYYEIACLCTH